MPSLGLGKKGHLIGVRLNFDDVMPEDEGTGATIGWPQEGQTIKAGESVFFQGVAINPEDGQLNVQVKLADGSVAAGDVVEIGQFGYWEANLLIPVDLEGEVQVIVDGGNESDAILLNVEK